MGKSTISMVIFNSYAKLPEGNVMSNCLGAGSQQKKSNQALIQEIFSARGLHETPRWASLVGWLGGFPILFYFFDMSDLRSSGFSWLFLYQKMDKDGTISKLALVAPKKQWPSNI